MNKKLLEQSECTPEGRADYPTLIDSVRTGEADLDYFFHMLAGEMRSLNGIDPYQVQPFKPFQAKVRKFLKERLQTDYETFVGSAKPERMTTDDFSQLPKGRLRKRLFDYRLRLYLAALEDCVAGGYDPGRIITELKTRQIPALKKDAHEPVFNELYDRFFRKPDA